MSVIDATTAALTSPDSSVVLVDVRSPSDWLGGVPINAQLWSHSELFNHAEQLKQDDKKVYIVCYRGQTSARLAEQLTQQWGDRFYSVEGGFEAWQALGLATEKPQIDISVNRYERQIKLSGFGQKSQQKLQDSHVLVVGAGGLGAPALLYLAGAGLGRITLIDDDTVALHNLHRQILYHQADVGRPKAEVAKQRLAALNDGIDIRALNQRLTTVNVEMLLTDVDLVIDGCDNISSRYVINDACLKLSKPWLFAAVSGFDIQLALFSGDKQQPCYRCLFPQMNDAEIGNCSEAGILGPVPGLAGMLQVTEAIKYLTDLGDCLEQKMLSYDVLHHQFKVLKYPAQINSSCNH
ncbi:Sulfur carrier protein ThiS adenylyltransferase [hydrothermal vent metagenome]|uniref:Sulfur carrier protein ThiS adenylyltransferase n=1 Tax=hydrothermal vent metagenome TaxID=652676 RepID=A0A3B0VXR9_9ZZZZ